MEAEQLVIVETGCQLLKYCINWCGYCLCRCGSCNGKGKIPCATCGSRGLIKCLTCQGSGSLLTRNVGLVRWYAYSFVIINFHVVVYMWKYSVSFQKFLCHVFGNGFWLSDGNNLLFLLM